MTIFGRRGEICEYDGDKLFAVTVLEGPQRWWFTQNRRLKAAGCLITQDGDFEGTAVFDSDNPKQARVALAAIRPYRRRTLSPEHREKALRALSNARLKLAESTNAQNGT